jgi:hypothetical protein
VSSPIRDRIRKLLALASNNPHEGEASSAAAMAVRLMAEHNISAADVAASAPRERVTIGRRMVPVSCATWEARLAGLVAGNRVDLGQPKLRHEQPRLPMGGA